MNKDHINSLAEYLLEQSKLFYLDFDRVSIMLSKEEVEYISKLLYEHAEPTEEEVKNYCKARELSLISNSLLSELISRK